MRKDEDIWSKAGLFLLFERQGVALYQNSRRHKSKDDRFVITIEECYTRPRNAADVLAWAEEAMTFARPVHSGIKDDNYIIFLYVTHRQHVHHFKDKHIVCIVGDHVIEHVVEPKMQIFIDAIKLQYHLRSIKREHASRRRPETTRHSYMLLIPLIVLTVYSYFGLHASHGVGGYSVNTIIGGNWISMLTYMFAHQSITHLVGNMIALWVIGKLLMNIIGPVMTITTYIGSGFVAALLDSLCMAAGFYGSADLITVGASSAIFGMMGALMIEAFHDRDLELRRGRLVLYIGICLFNSFMPGVSWSGHVFGLLTGILLGLLWVFVRDHTNYAAYVRSDNNIWKYNELLRRCRLAIREGNESYDKTITEIERPSRYETRRISARLDYVDSHNWMQDGIYIEPPSYARTRAYRNYIERGRY